MQRDSRTFLADFLESCDAMSAALFDMQIDDLSKRLVRSSVEREFTFIGEVVLVLSRKAPALFGSITNARRIVDFCNQLTHGYPTVDDELVWALAKVDLQLLRRECAALVSDLDSAGYHQDPMDETTDVCPRHSRTFPLLIWSARRRGIRRRGLGSAGSAIPCSRT
jgi:uncharacterized protein with HEPN domain